MTIGGETVRTRRDPGGIGTIRRQVRGKLEIRTRSQQMDVRFSQIER
jgi:hypothetical protein